MLPSSSGQRARNCRFAPFWIDRLQRLFLELRFLNSGVKPLNASRRRGRSLSPDQVSVRPSLATLPEISTFLLCSPSSLHLGSKLCCAPVLVAGRVKVLSVWAPESRPFPALQCPLTLLPECPCPRRSLIQCPLQRCSPTHPHAPSFRVSQATSHPLQAPCSFPVSASRPRLQPVLVVTALPRQGDGPVFEEQPFLPLCLRPREAKSKPARLHSSKPQRESPDF